MQKRQVVLMGITGVYLNLDKLTHVDASLFNQVNPK